MIKKSTIQHLILLQKQKIPNPHTPLQNPTSNYSNKPPKHTLLPLTNPTHHSFSPIT